MLPDLRVAIAAIAAAVVLLLAGFGVAATFRVAQQGRPSPLQAARSAVLTEPALRLEELAPVVSREEAAPADHRDETASIAPNGAPAVDEPAPVVAAVVAPAPVIAAAPVTARDVAAAPEAPDTPDPIGAIAAASHADAPVAAVPAPAAEPPVGGPLEQATLTPSAAPAAKPIVKRKPRAVLLPPRVDREKARARAAAKRAERARRAAAPQRTFQNSWQQNSWPQNSWQQNSWQNRPPQPAAGFENR